MAFLNFIKTHRLEILIIVLFGTLPTRILGLIGVDGNSKFYFLLFSIFFILLFKRYVVPFLLNTFLFQGIFFLLLVIENFLYTHPLRVIVFMTLIGYFLPIGSDWYNWILFFLFFLRSFAFRLQEIFLIAEPVTLENPSFGLEDYKDLTWEFVVKKLSFKSLQLYKKEINNRMPTRVSSFSFPFVAKRFMFKRAFEHVIQQKETYGLLATSFGTLFGGAAMLSNAVAEQQKVQNEAKRIDNDTKRIDNDTKQIEMDQEKLAYEKYKYVHEHNQKVLSSSSGVWSKKEPKNGVILDAETLNAEIAKYKITSFKKEKAVSTIKETSSFFCDWFF